MAALEEERQLARQLKLKQKQEQQQEQRERNAKVNVALVTGGAFAALGEDAQNTAPEPVVELKSASFILFKQPSFTFSSPNTNSPPTAPAANTGTQNNNHTVAADATNVNDDDL